MRNNAPLKEPQIRLFISPLTFPRRFRVKSSGGIGGPRRVHKDTRDRKEDYMYHCFTSPDVISSRRSVLNLTRGKRGNNDAKLRSESRVMQMVLLFRFLYQRYCAIAFGIHTYRRKFRTAVLITPRIILLK